MIPITTREEEEEEIKLMPNHKVMFINHQVTHRRENGWRWWGDPCVGMKGRRKPKTLAEEKRCMNTIAKEKVLPFPIISFPLQHGQTTKIKHKSCCGRLPHPNRTTELNIPLILLHEFAPRALDYSLLTSPKFTFKSMQGSSTFYFYSYAEIFFLYWW